MPKTFLLSDESINCYGIRILSSGLDVAAFQKNPLMLFMHERGKVIGRWVNLRQEEGVWKGDAEFDVDDAYANSIGGKVERGFLLACSVSVQIGELVWNDGLNCYDAVSSFLKEISIVDFGGNTNAVQLCDKDGNALSALELAAVLKPVTIPTTDTIPPITPMQIELKDIALAFGLPADATKEQVLELAGKSQAVSTATVELAALKATIKADKEKVAISLVDAAIGDKRISATQKDMYLKLFAADHEAGTTILASLPVPQNLVTLAGQGGGAPVDQTVEAATLYDQYDKSDRLVSLLADNPDEFKRLFKAKFGKEYGQK